MTNTIKYSLAALALVTLLFLYNRSSQTAHTYEGQKIFTGDNDDIYRIVLNENDKEVELLRCLYNIIEMSVHLSQTGDESGKEGLFACLKNCFK